LFSNITWATGFTSRDNKLTDAPDRQDMNWDNARTYFYQALTAVSKTDRDDNFIKTFRSVGQVMHLLQDMAVPAHVRNDFQSHLVFQGIKLNTSFTNWWANPFEYYVKNHSTLIGAGDPVAPSFTNPQLTDFWDTTDTAGDSPGNGLAEIVNRGYLSDQTIPGNNYVISDPYYNVHMFPLPQLVTGFSQSVDYLPNAKEPTRYLSRQVCPSCGSGIDHFVAYSLLTSEAEIKAQTANPNLRKYYLDDNVHKTYAGELLPMAVGYSAALLDYFFRGKIELSLPARGVYALAPPTDSYKEIRVRAKNTTSSSEEMSNGSIQLVVKYRLALSDPFQSEAVNFGPETYIVVPEKNNLRSISRTTPTELVFDLSADPSNFLPLWATNVYIQVVYKGTLGLETDAVAVGFRDISEPTPIDVFNNCDVVCLNGQWHDAGSQEVIDLVDTNPHNGIADEVDVYAYDINKIFSKASSVSAAAYVNANNYTFSSPELLPGGSFRRLGFILTDYDFAYSDMVTAVKTDSNDPWNRAWGIPLYSGSAIKNQVDSDGSYDPPIMYDMRGYLMWGPAGIVYGNSPYEDYYCGWDNL
jgi:hypothetical protein